MSFVTDAVAARRAASQSTGSWSVAGAPASLIDTSGAGDLARTVAGFLSAVQADKAAGGGSKTTVAPVPAPVTAKITSPAQLTSSVPSAVTATRLPAVTNTIAGMVNSTTPEDEAYNKLFGMMSGVVESQLRGEIPDDVRAKVERDAAARGLLYGLGAGSPADRALTARDLGLTSLDIQQKGMAGGEMLTKLAESRRMYNKTYQLQTQQFLEDVRRGDLSAAQIAEQSRQFNVAQQAAAAEMLLQGLTVYHEMALKYTQVENTAATRQSQASFEGDMANWLSIGRQIGGIS